MTTSNSTLLTLRDTRRAMRLTQAQMAIELGISLRTYCRQEKHGAPVPIMKLATLLITGRGVSQPDKSPAPAP